ncbi:MAG: hypothetical protein IPQ11_15395 [Bacteroidetes bacterium]|nr:hypothetical protein [Bacteroidota bacterium]
MIIKVLPVKSKLQVKRLIAYIAKDGGQIKDHKLSSIFHNLRSTELESIEQEFNSNFEEYRNPRIKNLGVHVILSISPLDKDVINIEMMDELSQAYLSKAFPRALSFGSHHLSQDHKHSHLLVSSNELMSIKSTALRKSQLFEIQKYMLDQVREKHPELKTSINLDRWGRKLNSEKEYYQSKRNPGTPLSRQELSEKLKELFRLSESSKDFYEKISNAGYNTYNFKERVQGIYWGEENKKMRFSRLQIEHETIEALDLQNERLKELHHVKNRNVERLLMNERDEDYVK